LWDKAQLHLAPATQISLCSAVADLLYAKFMEVRIGSANVLLIRLTDEGWAIFSRDPIPGQGRGDIAHQHVSHWIAMAAAQDGLKSACEFEINGHPVDCAVTDAEGHLHAYEVIVDCKDNLLHHLEILNASPSVRTVTVVCLQKRISQQLQQSLHEEPVVKALGDRLRFELAGTYLRRLWPCG
jgi:hypothetical protein